MSDDKKPRSIQLDTVCRITPRGVGIADVLEEIYRRGIKLLKHNGFLYYHPADRMTPELFAQLKIHGHDLLMFAEELDTEDWRMIACPDCHRIVVVPPDAERCAECTPEIMEEPEEPQKDDGTETH